MEINYIDDTPIFIRLSVKCISSKYLGPGIEDVHLVQCMMVRERKKTKIKLSIN